MKKHKLRIFSLALCIMMVLSLLPSFASAATIESDTMTVDGLEYTVSYVSATGISIQGTLTNVAINETSKSKPKREGNKITFRSYIDGRIGATGFSSYDGTYSFTDDNCAAALNKTVEYKNGDVKVVFTVTRSAASHTGGTCSNPVCTRCGKTYDAPHDYHYEFNVMQHRQVCSLNPSHVTAWENCSGGTSNCTNRAVCDFCGGELQIRKDDIPETVRVRLETYHRETEPLKAFYAERNLLLTVEGQDEVADTTALVFQALKTVEV